MSDHALGTKKTESATKSQTTTPVRGLTPTPMPGASWLPLVFGSQQLSFAPRQPTLVRPPAGPQRKEGSCSTCDSGESSAPKKPCGACAALPRLALPDSLAQYRRSAPSRDPAERQADEIGARIADDLPAVSALASGPLPANLRDVAERHLGVGLAATRLVGGREGHERASTARAFAVTEGAQVSFIEGALTTASEAGRHLLGHELTHVAQQQSAGRTASQNFGWDDVEHVADAAGAAAGHAYHSASAAVVGEYDSVTSAASSAYDDASEAVSRGAAAVASAPGGIVDWIETEAGKLALRAANAIAQRFGGHVTISPTGGIDITIADFELAESETETNVLPLGIPGETLFMGGFEVGTFVVYGELGTVYGDPAITNSVGPFRLQNILLHVDPSGGNYTGSAELVVGAALSGAVQQAHEARLEAVGVIPFEPPIPVAASAEAGIRTALRVAGREGMRIGVGVSYSGGTLAVRANPRLQLGLVAELDHEAFVRVEIETEEICSVIWPISTHRLFERGAQVEIPLSLTSSSGGTTASVGTPTVTSIPADSIVTALVDEHEPDHCMGLGELVGFLCTRGLLPPDVCSMVSPSHPSVGPSGGPGTPPVVPSPVGPSGPGPVPLGPVPPGPGGRPTPRAPSPDPDPNRCADLNTGAARPILTEGDADHGRIHIENRHAFRTGVADSWFLENGTTMHALTGTLGAAIPLARGKWQSSEDRETPGLFHCVAVADFGSTQVGWNVRNRNTDPPNVRPLFGLFLVVRSSDLNVVSMFPRKP